MILKRALNGENGSMDKKIKVTIVLPERLDKMLEIIANQRFTTKSGIIANALHEYFQKLNSRDKDSEA